MSESIVITGKGGVGKTTVCAALGAALSLQGRRVLLVDASLGLRGLDLPLGVENDILNTLTDLLQDRCSQQEALLEVPSFPGLFLLPAPQAKKPSDAGMVEMKILLRNLKKDFDTILIDAQSGIERSFLLACAGADRGMIVLSSDKASTRAAGRFSGLLQEAGLRDNMLFFNRLLPLGEADPVDPEEAADLLGLPVIGAAAECRELAFITENGLGFLKQQNDPAAKAFRDAARRMTGEELPISYPRPVSDKKGLISRLFGT